MAAAVTAGQKELGNGLGRRERSGNGVEEEEETSSGMCVGESGGGFLFGFGLSVWQAAENF